MKGVSTILSYSLLLLISLGLLIAVISAFSTITKDFRQFAGTESAQQLCFLVRSAIEKGYQQPSYRSQTNTKLAVITLNLPEKIADGGYTMRFVEQNITISTLSANVNATCQVGIPALYAGSTTGGKTVVLLQELANGSISIRLERGI